MAAVDPSLEDLIRRFAHSVGAARDELREELQRHSWLPADVGHLEALLGGDENENVRMAAAELLGSPGRSESLRALTRALREDASVAVQACAASAIGTIGSPDGIPALVQAVVDGNRDKVRFQAVAALGGLPGGARALGDVCASLDGNLRARAVQVLGEAGDDAAEPAAIAALASTDDRVALAGARAVRKLAGVRAIEPLGQVLGDISRSRKIRVRAASELGELLSGDAIPALTTAMLGDADLEISGTSAAALMKVPDGELKVQAVVEWLGQSTVERGQIDAELVTRALSAPEPAGFPSTKSLATALIEAAVRRDARMTALLASLFICACDNSVTTAGRRINELQAARGWSSSDIDAFRIEVGGQTALDPVLSALRADLHTYFQVPIHQLNEATRQGWERTIESAQQGFRARVYMSIAVFCVGIVLLAVSSIRFLTGDVSGDALYGTGVSFAAGLGTMLLVVYTGPLKEIRQSVSDLGSASAAFIAYVHQILEISHTFTSLYMRERMTFEEMEKSSRLIGDAMQATVACLTQTSQDRAATRADGTPEPPRQEG